MPKKLALCLVFVFVLILSGLPSTLAQPYSPILINKTWTLSGNDGAVEAYASPHPDVLKGQSMLKVTYDLHGTCLLGDDASALIFDQQDWKYISLSKYGKNCQDGVQTVIIPLSDFKGQDGQSLDANAPLDPNGKFHVRIWHSASFSIDIHKAELQSGILEPIPTSGISPTSTVNHSLSLTSTPTGNQSPITINGLTDGQIVQGIIYVSINADPDSTRQVKFYIDDSIRSVENSSPYYLGSDKSGIPNGFDTGKLSASTHQLKVIIEAFDHSSTTHFINFSVGTSSITPIPTTLVLPTPTDIATLTPTPSPVSTTLPKLGTWDIRSVDAMKETKDSICNQRSEEWIDRWLNRAVELGVNYIAISTPYDNPACGDAVAYTQKWVRLIRSKGLKVWHRQMPMAFEGIYSTPKKTYDYLDQIISYINSNPGQYAAGDIFTPIPEPQNGGIKGITYCAQDVCQFASKEAFNLWLRQAINESRSAFQAIGINDMKLGYYGFDGFVAWGANNPDWNGILDDATVELMGNITIDHYPELIGTNMAIDIADLEARYPGVDIIIGEWGTVKGGDTQKTVIESMGALVRPSVKGFNYWQFGPHGAGEQLIDDNFNKLPQFDEVQSYYMR